MVVINIHNINITTFVVPDVPSANGSPLVFIPKKPTTRFNGKNTAEIIVSV